MDYEKLSFQGLELKSICISYEIIKVKGVFLLNDHIDLLNKGTLNIVFSVTNSNCLGSILSVNRGILLPTLNPNPTFLVK